MIWQILSEQCRLKKKLIQFFSNMGHNDILSSSSLPHYVWKGFCLLYFLLILSHQCSCSSIFFLRWYTQFLKYKRTTYIPSMHWDIQPNHFQIWIPCSDYFDLSMENLASIDLGFYCSNLHKLSLLYV